MSLIKTALTSIRVKYPNNLDRDEHRRIQHGLLQSAIDQTNSTNSIIDNDLKEKARRSEGLTLEIPVLQRGNITVKNVRSCVISGGRTTSDLVLVTWKTLVADIEIVPSYYENNMIKQEADMAKQLNDVTNAFIRDIEETLEATLDAKKTQVYRSSIVTNKYTLVGGAIQVKESQQKYFFNDVQAINFADDFYDPNTVVIANSNVMPMVSWYVHQGEANYENTKFQFAGKNFYFSNAIENEDDVLGTGYIMPNGTLGILSRVNIDARKGHKAGDGTEWAEDTIPGFPFTVGIMKKSICADRAEYDATGTEHLTATMVEYWQISVDYAVLTPYESAPTTQPTAIRKFEIVADPATT